LITWCQHKESKSLDQIKDILIHKVIQNLDNQWHEDQVKQTPINLNQ
jgi:hypothetical protein